MRSILRVIHFKPLMFALLVAVVAFGVTAPIAPAQAATVVVANTNDSGGGFLRAAIAAASSGDTIDLTGLSGTILLTSGQLSSSKNLTISGPGAVSLSIDGNASSRIFNVSSGVTVSISGLTITNGDASSGGGISNSGTLT